MIHQRAYQAIIRVGEIIDDNNHYHNIDNNINNRVSIGSKGFTEFRGNRCCFLTISPPSKKEETITYLIKKVPNRI